MANCIARVLILYDKPPRLHWVRRAVSSPVTRGWQSVALLRATPTRHLPSAMQTPAARAAFRLSRAARSTSGASRGYKSSLDWVKAGCPSPASPVATAQPLIAVNPAEAAAAATEAADLVLGPVRRAAQAQTPIFAVMGFSAASIMILNLVYTVNEYDTPPKEEAEFEEVTGRYGGAFVRRLKARRRGNQPRAEEAALLPVARLASRRRGRSSSRRTRSRVFVSRCATLALIL